MGVQLMLTARDRAVHCLRAEIKRYEQWLQDEAGDKSETAFTRARKNEAGRATPLVGARIMTLVAQLSQFSF
jgi:hypothetical protein